jgi:biopolymer transport protein ExbD
MKVNRLKGKLRKIREEFEEEDESMGELNLVPYLDIATNVVVFLLATITFAAPLAQMDMSTPRGGGGGGSDKDALKLAVEVSSLGFFVAGNDPNLAGGGKRIAKVGENDYDWAALTSLLSKVKDGHPKEEAVALALGPYLPYELLIKTVDAIRSDGPKVLFPKAALGVVE